MRDPFTLVAERSPLRREGPGARWNLLTYTDQFDNGAWAQLGLSAVTVNATTDPFGGSRADKLVEDSGTSAHRVQSGAAMTTGNVYCMSVFAKAAERSQVRLQMNATVFSAVVALTFDLTDLSTTAGSAGLETSGIADVGGGWFRVWVTATATGDGTPGCLVLIANGGAASYAGDGASGLFVFGAQIDQGPKPRPYQWITDGATWGRY